MKRYLLLTLFLASAAAVAAAADNTVTEFETVKAVVANNSEVSAAKNRYFSARSESVLSWGLKNPMLEVEFMGMDSSGFSPAEAGSKSIAVSQKIPFPAKLPFMIGRANEAVNAGKYRHEMSRRQAGLKAYNAYASLYRIIKEIEITKEAASALKQVSQIASAGYGRSQDSVSDGAMADLEYALLQNRLISLEAEAGVAGVLINTLSNGALTITPNTRLEPPSIEELPGSLEQLTTAAVENSPEVMIMEAELRMAENGRNYEFINFFPDINIKFKKQTEPASDNYSLMFEAEIPFWFFVNNVPAALSSAGNYDAAKAAYEEERNRAVYEAKINYEAAKTYSRTIKLYSEMLIPRAEAVFQAAVTGYRSGSGAFMKVVDSQRRLLEMKKDYYMFVEKYVMHYRDLMACCAVSFLQDGEIYGQD